MQAIIGPNWASIAWRGVASVVFGTAALAWPEITLAALTIVFGVYTFADGVLAFLAGSRRGYNPHRWLLLLDGTIGVLAAFVTLLWPRVGLLGLVFIVGVRSILVGALQIAAGWQLRNTIVSPWLYVLSGSLTVVFGITALVLPGVTAFVLVTVFGIYALFFGAAFLALAYGVRRSGERFLVDATPI